MKTVIIGGVAGGAACAARLRRLDENAEIVILEKGSYISYANCGLPYYVGGIVKNREALLVQTPESMSSKFNIDVRVKHEVTCINRTEKTVNVMDHTCGKEYTESYDKLVISTGSKPAMPGIPGIESKNIHTLWSVPDADVLAEITANSKSIAVIGGGFVGLEVTESLKHAGLEVSLIEGSDQVMDPVDPEMASLLHEQIRLQGVSLHLSDGVEAFTEEPDGISILLRSGKTVHADAAVLSIGVRPNSALAKEAGLACNRRGYVVVDEHMRTSDLNIYAAGDIVEVDDLILGGRTPAPLAGPASKEGRIIADNICETESGYKGTQSTSIAKVFDLTVACTGMSEKKLIAQGYEKNRDFKSIIITQNSHVGFYPGSEPMCIKLIYSPDGSKIFGAQIVGGEGTDKRIDVIAAAIRLGGNVHNLEELELAYAPPYSSAKDPVNMAGFVAINEIKGLVSFSELVTDKNAVLLDVREKPELLAYEIPNAVNIPLSELRSRLDELDKSKSYVTFCALGLRGYIAARVLMQRGFGHVKVYPGGTKMFRAINAGVQENAHKDTQNSNSEEGRRAAMSLRQNADRDTDMNLAAETENGGRVNLAEDTGSLWKKSMTLDCCGMQCPGPLMRVNETVEQLKEGDLLSVSASDPGFTRDITAWCSKTGNTIIASDRQDHAYRVLLQKGNGESQKVVNDDRDGKTIIVFSGDFDKVMASFIIANGAAAMGKKVTMFFTFWGLTALRKSEKQNVKKTFMESMFGTMLPRGVNKLGLSRMNMAGMGTAMMKKIMKDKNVNSLEDLVKSAISQGVNIMACTMSMDVMGIKPEELIDGVEMAGVGTYLGEADDSNVNLFI